MRRLITTATSVAITATFFVASAASASAEMIWPW